MTKRKIQSEEEFEKICILIDQIKDILLAIGIVELKISKATMDIFWDTEGGGLLDPVELDIVGSVIESTWMDLIDRKMGQ